MQRYDKAEIEKEALISVDQGYLTDKIGKFILDRAVEIAGSAFVTDGNKELNQALIDAAVMRTCEKFLFYYKKGKSAANLIISIIYSTMTNRIVSLRHSDIYGGNVKGYVSEVNDGTIERKLKKYQKDDYLSERL